MKRVVTICAWLSLLGGCTLAPRPAAAPARSIAMQRLPALTVPPVPTTIVELPVLPAEVKPEAMPASYQPKAPSATAKRIDVVAPELMPVDKPAADAKPKGAINPLAFSSPVSIASETFSEPDVDAPQEPPPADISTAVVNLIDLPTTLRLANAGNLQVVLAREQTRQAWAQHTAAKALWLPSINGGMGYNKHEGNIQDIRGQVFPISRNNMAAGLGAAVPGAASPALPGLYANVDLADALFRPLAARQGAYARNQAALAATNDVLLKVSLGYLELLRAAQETAIAIEARDNAQQLADLTAAYATSGQGLQSDADRAVAELAQRKNDVLRGYEAVAVSSARLAQLLRLDPTVRLEPAEPVVVPLELVCQDVSVCELIAQALTNRPELAECRHLVAQAVAVMRRERYAVLLPSVILGASYTGFGGGQGSFTNFGNRMDADAIAYWQIRNLGLGEAAARNESKSLVRQANTNQLATMDLVTREVVEAHAQIVARFEQIETAREGVAAATASHQKNLDRIRDVQGLPIEVLQSNQALAQAQREYLRTLVDYNAAQFSLYRALGWPVKTLTDEIGVPTVAEPDAQ